MTPESSNRRPSLPCESDVSVILKTISIISVELVEWRSGQVVFLPLSRPESTGSTLLNAKFFMP
jgi:argininosuccinate lyase